MPLQFQNVPVPLAVGLDLKTDAKLVGPGSVVGLENFVLNKGGRADKRNGYLELPTAVFGGTSISSGNSLDTYRDELLLFDGPSLYTYAPGASQWQPKGTIPPCVVRGKSAARNMSQQTVPDAATCQGQTVYAWEDSRGGVRASVIDDSSGAMLVSDQSLNSGGANPRVVAFNTTVAVIYRVTNALKCVIYTPSTATFSSETTPSSDIHSDGRLDACYVDGHAALVVYKNTTPALAMAYLLPTGSFAGVGATYPAATTITANPDQCIACVFDPNHGTQGRIWLAWMNTTAGLRCAIRNGDFTNPMPSFTFAPSDVNTGTEVITHAAHGLASNMIVQFSNSGGGLPAGLSASTNYYVIYVDADTFKVSATDGPGSAVNITSQGTGTHTLQIMAATVDAGTTVVENVTGALDSAATMRWFYQVYAAATYNRLVKANTMTTAGVAGTAATLKRSVGLASKAFIYSDVTYVALAHDSTLQATYFICDVSGNLIAKAVGQNGGGLTAKQSALPQVRSDSAGTTRRFAALRKNRLVSQDDNVFTLKGVWDVTLAFSDPAVHWGVELGDVLHIAGGVLYGYDGQGPVEQGFHLFPENLSSSQTTGGSLTLLGTYQYRAVYEWTDAQGNLHRSAPSPALTVTLTGSNTKATITIPTLRLTAKTSPRGEVSIALYRTTDGGSTFYRDSSITSPTYNAPGSDSVTIDSTTSDATIIGNEQLYTNGGAVENDPPPPVAVAFASKSRVWVMDSENPLTAWYSKARVEGRGMAFSAFQTIDIPPDGGDVTAIAEMDGYTVFFKKNRIYAVSGEGPDDLLANNFYSQPVKIQTDVGTIDQNTVVLTGDGLLFKSVKGWYLLSRALQVTYLGAPVEDLNSLTTKAATLIPGDNQVRLLHSDGAAIVFSTYWQQWMTWTQHEGVDAVLWNDVYHYLRSDGKVRYEAPGTYADESSRIPTRNKSPWLRVGGLLGYQRVSRLMILGDYQGRHTLTVRLRYNFNDTSYDELTLDTANFVNPATWGSETAWGSGDVWGGLADNVYAIEVIVPARGAKCTALQVEIIENPAEPTDGLSLVGLELLIGVKKGLKKNAITKRAS